MTNQTATKAATELPTETTITLPAPVARRGISEPVWRALCASVFPGASSESILMAWDYCKARNLDPLKKVVHIVPMFVKDAKTGNKEWRDVVMPGIAELRTTAHRTKQYAGIDEPEFGPEFEYKGIKAPKWCRVSVYRMLGEQRCKFTHPEYFQEAVAESNDGNVNPMWKERPYGQLAKCAEAGALRKAFPEELGNEYTAEEMHGRQIIEATATHVDDSATSATATEATATKVADRIASVRAALNPTKEEGKANADTNT